MSSSNISVVSSDPNVDKITNGYTIPLSSKVIINDNQVYSFNALSTDYELSAKNDLSTLSGNGYKTRESKLGDISLLKSSLNQALEQYQENQIQGTTPTQQIATATIPPSLITTEFDELSITIDGINISQKFDNDAQTTLKKFADQISAKSGFSATVDSNGNLTITNIIPGDNVLIDGFVKLETPDGNSQFSVITTTAQEGSGFSKVLAIEDALKNAIQKADAKYLRLYNTLDLNSTQTSDIQLMLDNLGISNDPFGESEINDGIVYIKQGYNRFAVAKISTVVFTDELSLEAKGNNLFSQTLQSGEPIFSTTQNKILGATLELSNSDLGKGLVNLMVYQRAFEASSKSITTSDEFLKTAIQLKR